MKESDIVVRVEEPNRDRMDTHVRAARTSQPDFARHVERKRSLGRSRLHHPRIPLDAARRCCQLPSRRLAQRLYSWKMIALPSICRKMFSGDSWNPEEQAAYFTTSFPRTGSKTVTVSCPFSYRMCLKPGTVTYQPPTRWWRVTGNMTSKPHFPAPVIPPPCRVTEDSVTHALTHVNCQGR